MVILQRDASTTISPERGSRGGAQKSTHMAHMPRKVLRTRPLHCFACARATLPKVSSRPALPSRFVLVGGALLSSWLDGALSILVSSVGVVLAS